MLDPEKLVADLWRVLLMVDREESREVKSAIYSLIKEVEKLPPRYATRGEKKAAVFEALAADPFQSSRKIADKLGVSHVFVARCRRPMPEIAG